MEMSWFLPSVHCHSAGYQDISFLFLFREKEFVTLVHLDFSTLTLPRVTLK